MINSCRLGEAISDSTSWSTAGLRIPIRLRLPSKSADSECQNSRCSLPGERDCPITVTTMSKSKLRKRLTYCEGSTTRTLRSIPKRSKFFLKGSTIRSKAGETSRISKLKDSPALLTRLRLLASTFQPAALSSAPACRN